MPRIYLRSGAAWNSGKQRAEPCALFSLDKNMQFLLHMLAAYLAFQGHRGGESTPPDLPAHKKQPKTACPGGQAGVSRSLIMPPTTGRKKVNEPSQASSGVWTNLSFLLPTDLLGMAPRASLQSGCQILCMETVGSSFCSPHAYIKKCLRSSIHTEKGFSPCYP